MSEHARAVHAGMQALSVVVVLACSACSLSGSHASASDKPSPASNALAAAAGDASAGPACPQVASTVVEGKLADDEIDELSGIIASRKNPGVFWVHNDSGDDARTFAIDLHGRAVAELRLGNVDAHDIEDIALVRGQGKAPDLLYLADTGDNSKHRASVQLYRVEEPRLELDKERIVLSREAKTIDVKYEDGPHDAETLLADPVQGDLYLVAKSHNFLSEQPVGVYRLPAAELRTGRVLARKVATIALGATTAGDIAPDGSAVMVRNYWSAMYWPRAAGESIASALAKPGCRMPVSDISKQGESLAFTADGSAYVTVPEGLHPAVYRYSFKR
ncbi:MAG: hypothetical protein JWN48_3416 [Myxococcaceae bacterium]|nr:hypothetical protein [Myxococcaceae bacterium]